MKFLVESVNVSNQKGVAKKPVPEVEIVAGSGIRGDAHAGPGHRQVSFLAAEAIERMAALGLEVSAGSFGENIVTRGIDWSKSQVNGRIAIGTAEFIVTQIGKECQTPCSIYYSAGECIMPKEGIFVRVLKGGFIRAQDSGNYNF